eukprot:CAMPEP_0201631856 /NCGR_PEP_ID=MMETSP0493-20130528/5687_1 /ASSEMBLY_ACC=CAM_ASM_000838 /TAXON_ID=420259 /ORGANISM="Thalassiosira gravida, Strain GMp14c1" /LENGTH=73 /DNA_ID=CAMNT_0048103263 /DNA_START=49 /DNA_END=271 /DNA_ORIENTATION=-
MTGVWGATATATATATAVQLGIRQHFFASAGHLKYDSPIPLLNEDCPIRECLERRTGRNQLSVSPHRSLILDE